MLELGLWTASILIGLLVTHVYYRKSVGKRLSFFLLLDEQPFALVDRNVFERVKITFSIEPAPGANLPEQPTGIRWIQHLQVIVANTGSRAITFNTPPALDLPAHCQILDATIIHQSPEDLGAKLARLPVERGQPQQTLFAVKMLNPGEYVLAKFLFGDIVATSDLKIHLLAEDLPRTIPIEALPVEATKTLFKSVEWSAVWVGLAFILSGVCIFLRIAENFAAHPLVGITEGFFDFLFSIQLPHLELLVGFLSSMIAAGIGVGLIFQIGLKPLLKTKRVILPPELRPGSVLDNSENETSANGSS